EQRPARRDADDRRLDARRHDRDAARKPAPGRACDARAADRRRARGCRPARVPLRPLANAGLGGLLVFFGVALLSVRFVRPLAETLGWPAAKIGGAAGELARDNAQRNPQRTASTASALMIGLALVTLVAVLAAGITSTFRGAVNELWGGADYAVTAQNNFSPIPVAAANAAAKAPGVEAV